MYLDILHVFYTYPIGVQDTFGIHIRYIKIHVNLMRFLDVTLDTYQDTSGYMYLGLLYPKSTCNLNDRKEGNISIRKIHFQ